MELDERVDYIESEITLIKGEIQQALVELRDMVTVIETRPSEQESQIIEIRQGGNVANGEAPKAGEEGPVKEPKQEEKEQPIAEVEEEEQPVAEVEEEEQPEEPIEEEPEPDAEPVDQPTVDQQPLADMQPPPDWFQELDTAMPDTGSDPNQLGTSQYPDSGGYHFIPQDSSQLAVEVRSLDIHSVANIIRWVGGLRPRIGLTQLWTLLEIYQTTGHLPESIEDLVLEAAKLDALPDAADVPGYTLEEYIDSILQLHAIVSGLEYRQGGYGHETAQGSSSSNGAARMAGGSPDSGHLGLEPGQVHVQQAPVRVSANPRYPDEVVRGYGQFYRLDANLVSNLMRWAGTVQPKIGQDQLETLLRVYKLTGNLPPAVERMLLKAAQLETLPGDTDGTGFTLQDFIDSLLKLHGIVHSTEYQSSQAVTEYAQPPPVIRDRYG